MKTGEIYFKKCSSCKLTLSIDNFNKDSKRKDGKQRYCRECRNKKRREYSSKQRKKGWDVYILPKENYAGLSNDVRHRIQNHKADGKNTEGWHIFANFDKPELAIIQEALLHLQGYKGCAFKKNVN